MRSIIMIRTLVACVVLGIGIVGGWYSWQRFYSQHSFMDLDLLASYDNLIPVAIIGSGPAGLSAATYTGRSNVFTVVFQGKQRGGQLMGTSYVENWPGIPQMLGPDLMNGALEQAKKSGAVTVAESIVDIDVSSWPYTLSTESGMKIHALTVIFAMGATPKRKDIPGENEYWGRGVSTCAICDAPFYKNSDVVIIGGGDSAAEEALQLASYAEHITLLVRGDTMRASPAMQQRVAAYKNINIRYNTDITRIIGDAHFVTHIELVTKGTEKSIMPIDGVFLAIGHSPNTTFIRDAVTCDNNGYIVLQKQQETSKKGIFAAGDVVDYRYRQAGVAAGDGIKAALDALSFLRDIGINDYFLDQLKPHFFVPEQEGERKQLPAISTKKELNNLLKTHTTVVLDFFTPTCHSCMQLLPAVESAAALLADKVYFAKVDASLSLELAEYLVVPKVPTLIVFNHGSLAARSKEVMTKQELLDFLQKIMKS